MEKEQIIFSAAGKVHEAWCKGEIDAFYDRMIKAHDSIENPGDAVRSAGMKNGAERNIVSIDAGFMSSHKTMSDSIFESRTAFDFCVKGGGINIKRFANRELTPDEYAKFSTTADVRQTQDGKIQENILRPFGELSSDSQKENLAAAENAMAVYDRLKQAGMTDEEMTKPENQAMIGTIIHTSWMQRNEKTEGNAYLFCPYEKLGDWEKGQDLDVFKAVVLTAKEQEYNVEQDPNIKLPTPEEIAIAEANAIAMNKEQE